MKILVIDNHDSFTYNLVQLIRENNAEPVVRTSENINKKEIKSFEKILISPGPGLPADKLKDIIRQTSGYSSLLGVCLGHQAIAEVFGGKLKQALRIYHGEALPVFIKAKDYFLFKNMDDGFAGGRYHSWIVDKDTLPDILEITASDPDDEIMGLRHKGLDIHSIQFHPESILTPQGDKIIINWLES
jgi:anthranilate synthase component II